MKFSETKNFWSSYLQLLQLILRNRPVFNGFRIFYRVVPYKFLTSWNRFMVLSLMIQKIGSKKLTFLAIIMILSYLFNLKDLIETQKSWYVKNIYFLMLKMSYIRSQGSSLATVNFVARLTFKQYKSCSPENVKLFSFLKNIYVFLMFWWFWLCGEKNRRTAIYLKCFVRKHVCW